MLVVIFDIGAVIQTTAQSYGELVAGRAIGGIGVGTLAMVLSPLPFPLPLGLSNVKAANRDSC